MTNSFWFSGEQDDVQLPASEPPYEVKESVRFDGDDNKLTRTPSETDGSRVGETGNIQAVAYNTDGTVTLTVADGLEPHQSLQGDYLQVGDTLTQDIVSSISSASISAETTPYVINGSVVFGGTNEYLSRAGSFDPAGNRKTWTLSFWAKMLNIGYYPGHAFSTNTAQFQFEFRSSGQYQIANDGCFGNYLSESTWDDPNGWHHFVIQHDSTQSYCKVYVDGELDATITAIKDSDGVFNGKYPHAIGATTTGTSNPSMLIADVHLIDGYAHGPDAFAEYNYTGAWAPKTPVLTRTRDPYSYRPNLDQVWSSGTNNSEFYQPVTNIFNGDSNARAVPNTDRDAIHTFATPFSGSKFEAYVGNGNFDDVQFGLTLDGLDITTKTNSDSPQWATIYDGTPAECTRLLLNCGVPGGGDWYRLRVDGRELVDTGLMNVDKSWSDYLSSGPNNLNFPPSMFFDGNNNTFNSTLSTGTNANFEFDFGSDGPTATSSVSIFGASVNWLDIYINDVNFVTSQPGADTGLLIANYTGQINKLKIQVSGGGITANASAIYVDDIPLVDSGNRYNTTQNFSDAVTSSVASFGGSKGGMFDGITPYTSDDWSYWYASGYQSNNQPIQCTFETPVPITSTFEAYVYRSSGDYTAKINGVDASVSMPAVSNIGCWATVTLPAGTTSISSFELNGTGGFSSGNGCAAIKIDGVYLVDGDYGSTGYHLPFSSTNIGDDTSDNDNDWVNNNLDVSTGDKVAINTITFAGGGSSGHRINAFYLDSQIVTSSVFTSATNNVGQYDSGMNSTFFPRTYDGDTTTGLDWKSGSIDFVFTNKTVSYVDFVGDMVDGEVVINGVLQSPKLIGNVGGIEIYRVQVAPTESDIDIVIDSPTGFINTDGNVVGNYATWSPYSPQYETASHVLSDGNLKIGNGVTPKGNYSLEASTLSAPNYGKWYWEMVLDGYGQPGERRMLGVMAADANFAQYIPHDNSTDGLVALWCFDGQKIINGVKSAYTNQVRSGDIVAVALDQDKGNVEFYINGVGAGLIALPGNMVNKRVVAVVSSIYEQAIVITNFGQKSWVYGPPAGYNSFCQTNM